MLWPVVDKVPARTDVLYSGATYLESFSFILVTGTNKTAGRDGFISPDDKNYVRNKDLTL